MYPATFSVYVKVRPWSLTWKTISFFLSSFWSIVTSCMIMELRVHFVSCLQRFPTLWQYHLDLSSPTLKNDRHLSQCNRLRLTCCKRRRKHCFTQWTENIYAGNTFYIRLQLMLIIRFNSDAMLIWFKMIIHLKKLM